MIKPTDDKGAKEGAAFSKEVGASAARKLKAKRNAGRGVWFGLGMMGLVGWSVVVPTLAGAALGIWLDRRRVGSGNYSWTLMLLLIGLMVGCLNAWYWVAKQEKEMQDDEEDKDE